MPFRLPNAVHETTTTSGTGPLTLLGAVTDRKTFGSQLSNGDTTMIVITDGTDWECAVGTFTSPSTISRDTVIYSTNGNALVNWPASGTRDVFIATAGEVFAGLVDPAMANGVIVKTGDRAYAGRSIDVDTDDLQIANPAGTAGNPTLALAFAVSAFAKSLLDDPDQVTARSTLGITATGSAVVTAGSQDAARAAILALAFGGYGYNSASGLTIPYSPSFTTLTSVTLTVRAGSVVFVQGFANGEKGSTGGNVEIQITRTAGVAVDTTSIFDPNLRVYVAGGTGAVLTTFGMIYPLESGSLTLSLQGRCDTGSSVTTAIAKLAALEIRP